jgi:putative tryptophan/tyrosine transport system substrate-binding protein
VLPVAFRRSQVERVNRRRFLYTLSAGVLLLGRSGVATGQQRVPRIGVLRPTSANNPYTESFRQGLRELGYVEGRSIHIEYRYSEGRQDLLPALAAELVALKPDVILTDGPGIRPVKAATGQIPIIFAVTGDPVGEGVVRSLARPGGNATGLSLMAPLVNTKRVEILKELLPRATRFSVLWNEGHSGHRAEIDELTKAAARLRVALSLTGIRASGDFAAALAAGVRDRTDGLVVLDDALIFNEGKTIADFAFANRWPAIYPNRGFTVNGGLMSYGPSLADLFRRAAGMVDKILKGANPGDLPVEQPTRFEFVVNQRIARALGITLPQALVLRADDVVD